MKTILRALALLLLAALPLTHAETVKSLPAPTGYIDDYAQVLTPAARAELEAVCRELHSRTRAQLFFVTIHTLDGVSRDEFANDLFHIWKIGEKKTDRGVLILLAIDDHQRRIEVGYGLEGILNDAKAGDIGREMVPSLKLRNYDEAARIGIDAIANIVAADSNVRLDSLNPPPAPPAARPEPVAAPNPAPASSSDAFGIFIIIAIFAIFLVIAVAKSGGRETYHSNNSTYVAPFYDPTQPSNSTPPTDTGIFSSFTDSSSSDSSSSDIFSGGDGGDSGGGGAGGDW